jgi:hypothetical protein
MSKYDLEKIRKNMKDKAGSNRFKDEFEFKPANAKEGETIKYRFFILPPLKKGDKCTGGTASKDMELFFVQNGSHWFAKRPYPCPRVHDQDECPICQYGFDLMGDTKEKDKRSAIAKAYLPRALYAVNIYFTNSEANPEELRGRVMWWNPSKQIFDVLERCLYKEGSGDQEDPEAYGVFFDEESAYVFQLEATKNGEYNDYKTSKFLAKSKMPIAATKVNDKITPDPEGIKTILDMRHDLYTKFDPRDRAKLKEVAHKIIHGGEGNEAEEDQKRGFTEGGETGTEAGSAARRNAEVAPNEGAVVESEAPKAKESPRVNPTKAEVKAEPAETPAGDATDEELESLLHQINKKSE